MNYNLIAHRAKDNSDYAENTKEAVLNAINKPYISGIEIDVRETKDKKLVVIHDMTINRVSNGAGFVCDYTYKELKKYNFGTDKNYSFITTLKEVLEVLNDKILLIEIKFEAGDLELFITNFYKEIKNYLDKNIYITSFNNTVISKLKKKYPLLKCGLLISGFINFANLDKSLDFYCISSYSLLQYEDLINSNKMIFVWALKFKKTYENIKNKYDNLYYIVDFPQKFINF